MLKCRFGSENQAEMYKAEMKARRRKSGESLQKLYQDLCRLRALAFGNEPATAFSKAYLTDIFVDALDDRDLRKLVLIQKPTSMEDALQIATHLEAIDVSTAQACRDRRDDCDTHRNRQRVNQVERSDGVKNNHTEITKQLQEVKNAVLSFQKEMQQKQFVAPASGFGESNLNAVGPSTQVRNQNGSSWTSGENAATSSAQLLPRGTAGPRQTRVPANTCRYCGIEGHWQADCPEILKKSFKQKGASMMPQGNHNPWRTGQNFNRNNVLTSPSKMRGEIYLEIKIRAQRLGALLDTGCQHSVIGRKLIPTMKLEPTTQTLCTASGADLPLLGECVLHFRVGDYPTSVKVVVTEALTEFILGIDWLQSNKCTWDFANNRFAVKGHEAKILDKHSKKAVRRLYVDEDTDVPARCQRNVKVMATMETLKTSGSWAVKPRAVDREMLVASSVFDGPGLSTVIRVINLSEKTRRLRKGFFITDSEPVELISCETGSEKASLEDTSYECGPGYSLCSMTKEPVTGTTGPVEKLVEKPVAIAGVTDKDTDHLKELFDSLKETLPDMKRRKAERFLQDHSDVFSKSEYDLGRTDLIKHTIDTGTNKPFKQQLRRHPMAYLPIIDEHVEEMVAHGIVEPTTSPWSSNVVLVRKQDGSLRFCVDFRTLNNLTFKDSYPLPRIDTCFDALGGAKYFSTLDLRSGYWQVQLDKESSEKTAFVTRKGVYKFNVLAFGLSNAPAIFQRLMDLVLAGLTWQICLAFLDDIIVMSETFEQHLERLALVFDRLREANLKLKPSKCHLFQRKVKFLGSVVSDVGIEPDPDKVSAVKDWPIPKNLTELRAFVALASYYRRHILHFADIARPLHALTKRNEPFVWGHRQQEAFQELKNRLTSAPVLSAPLPEGEYIVDTDASDGALGAVLQQRQDGIIKVIAYASRVLSSAEQSYCTTRKELLAIIFGLKTFRHYLLVIPFTLRTDHAALTSLMKTPEPVGQQARWLDLLAEYNFTILHRAGISHGNADGLSRRPCGDKKCRRSDCAEIYDDEGHDSGKEDQKRNACKVLRSDQIETVIAKHAVFAVKNTSYPCGLSLEIVRSEQKKDLTLSMIRVLMETVVDKNNWRPVDEYGMGVTHLWSQVRSLEVVNDILHRNFEASDGTILYQQVLVPGPLRKNFLAWVHDDPTSGHFGVQKTQAKLQNYAYWPGWRKDVELYVRRCDVCCRYRRGPKYKQGTLQNAPGLAVMQKFHCDLTGPHPRSKNGFVYLLTGICCFTKYLITVPIRDKTALTVAKALVKNVYLIYGAVELQIHDQGTEFCIEVLKNVSRLMGIQDLKTTSYRASVNGAIEVTHKLLNAVFAKTIDENQRNWCELASYVTFAYNTSRHSSTTFTPFFLMFNRHPRVGIDMLLDTTAPGYQNFDEFTDDIREKMQTAYSIVETQLRVVFDRAKRRYDSRVKEVQFEEGDYVYYFTPKLTPGRGRKWKRLSTGPWRIKRKINQVNYVIQKNPAGRVIIVHIDRLRKFEAPLRKVWTDFEKHSGRKDQIFHNRDVFERTPGPEKPVCAPKSPVTSRRDAETQTRPDQSRRYSGTTQETLRSKKNPSGRQSDFKFDCKSRNDIRSGKNPSPEFIVRTGFNRPTQVEKDEETKNPSQENKNPSPLRGSTVSDSVTLSPSFENQSARYDRVTSSGGKKPNPSLVNKNPSPLRGSTASDSVASSPSSGNQSSRDDDSVTSYGGKIKNPSHENKSPSPGNSQTQARRPKRKIAPPLRYK